MDRAKAAFFNARQEIAGTLAKPADADKAISELMRYLDVDAEKPSPSSAKNYTALKALSLLWGSTPNHDDKEISAKIDGYRKRYVAAKGGDAEERADAASDFDKSVKMGLANSLGPRNHSVYGKALSQHEQRWADGNLTRPQLHEKMAATSRQLVNDIENIPHDTSDQHLRFFKNEVKGALQFVGNEQDLMGALNYLWGGKPDRENEDKFKEFDKVMNDVVSLIVESEEKTSSSSTANLDRDQAFLLKKREFIAESRSYLGSLLPDETKVKEYIECEAVARSTCMQPGNPDYAGYKKQMLHHLASMRTEVLKNPERNENARLDNAVEEAVARLLEKDTEPRAGSTPLRAHDAVEASYLDMVGHESGKRWKDLQECRERYVEVSMQKNLDEYDSRRAFMRATQKLLIEGLPENIRNNFKKLLVALDSFHEKGFIANDVYNFTALKLFKKVNGETFGAESSISKVFLRLPAKNESRKVDGDSKGFGSLQDEVTKALKTVLNPVSDPAEVLGCLGCFWGISPGRLTLHKYGEFGIHRNRYTQAHGGHAVSDIPTDCAFVAEARSILLGRMPTEFQAKYKAQQDALKEFGMSATAIAKSTQHFLVPFILRSPQ